MDQAEISDLIVAFDPHTLARRPVRKPEVVDYFRARGNGRAARIVARLPERNGVLDPDEVDRLLVKVHCEMQRIAEEFEHGHRALEVLSPVLATLREAGAPRPMRLVDLGCGTGFIVRWLAAHAGWTDVELVGADYNVALVEEARRLAAREGLRCSFVVANAFELDQPALVFISTGVLHHFRGEGLDQLFSQHQRPTTQAFVHFDFQPSPLANFGSWLFHAVRMREPLSRHDGVLSAVRAHPGEVLLGAARRGCPGFATSLFSQKLGPLPIPRAFQAILGIRPPLREALVRALGERASRLGGFQ